MDHPPSEPLSWADVAERLAAPRNYWLHTTSPTGRPDASPVWGVVSGGVWHCYTARTTVKARNLGRERRVVVHLESASEVLIVQGRLDDLGHPDTSPAVVEAFARKYDRPEEQPFLPSSNRVFDALYALRPRRALAWQLPDSEASTRRWSA